MTQEDYKKAGETMTLISWLNEKITDYDDFVKGRKTISTAPALAFGDQTRYRIGFELLGYDGKNQKLPEEIIDDLKKVAEKIKSYYKEEKEKLEKELELI